MQKNKYGGTMSAGDRLLAEYTCETALRQNGFVDAADEIAALRAANERLLTLLEWSIVRHAVRNEESFDWESAVHQNWGLCHEAIRQPACILAHFAPVKVSLSD